MTKRLERLTCRTIKRARDVHRDQAWLRWARRWLSGDDRSARAALRVRRGRTAYTPSNLAAANAAATAYFAALGNAEKVRHFAALSDRARAAALSSHGTTFQLS